MHSWIVDTQILVRVWLCYSFKTCTLELDNWSFVRVRNFLPGDWSWDMTTIFFCFFFFFSFCWFFFNSRNIHLDLLEMVMMLPLYWWQLSFDLNWCKLDGLGLLTMSAVFTSHDPLDYQIIEKIMSCSSQLQLIFFFFCLYLVAVTQGGHKPCNQAFGGDQFNGQDSKECKVKDSFFD